MTALAVVILFMVGALFGLFIAALLTASTRGQQPLPLHLSGEGPAEHVSNSLQILASFSFLNDQERAGDRGMELITAAIRRQERALKQLRRAG